MLFYFPREVFQCIIHRIFILTPQVSHVRYLLSEEVFALLITVTHDAVTLFFDTDTSYCTAPTEEIEDNRIRIRHGFYNAANNLNRLLRRVPDTLSAVSV